LRSELRISVERTAASPAKVVLALGSVYLIWGSVFLAIRLVIEDVDPFQAMAQRFLVAGLLLAGWLVIRHGWVRLRVQPGQLAALVLTGVLLLGLGNGLQAWGQLEGLSSGVAALFVATVPAWVVLLRLIDRERPSLLTLIGVAAGFAGLVLLVVLGRGLAGPMPLFGVILVLAASCSWSVGSFLQGRMRLPGDLLVVITYQQFAAAGCSAVLAVGTGEQISVDYSARGWTAMAYLVVVCSLLGFTAYAWLLTNVPLSLTATHAYVNPVVAVLLGWLVLAEPVGLGVLLGGAMVVVAVILIVSGERWAAKVSRATATADVVESRPLP
jgi:drug/metabolite transporter (DMT)-like permease